MRLLALSFVLAAVMAAPAQSRRAQQAAPPQGSVAGPAASGVERTVKELFDDANGYLKAKAAEYEAKKVPFSEKLLTQARQEQRQLAAKYAALAGERTGLAGDDLYYLGMLHWIAVNLDGTVEALWKYINDAAADPARRQTARSIVTVVLSKQKKLDEAEALLAAYLKNEPTKLTELARMQGELAKAYQSQKDFARMAPHAEEDYKAAKLLLSDATSRARGLDEVLDAGMLVFEAYRDGGDQKKADAALDDMQQTALDAGSPSFYFYAVDRKVKFLIDTGRKPQALTHYAAAIAAADGFRSKELQADAATRLKKREKHYKLLGDTAPELPLADQWFPGERRTLASLRGKVVLLDFWATWCGPCFEAFPTLIELHQEHARQGLEILGVTRYYGMVNGMPADPQSEAEFLKRFRVREGLPYDLVVARDQSMQHLYGATGLPTAVVIDRKGVVRYIESGTNPTRLFELREMIERLLAEK